MRIKEFFIRRYGPLHDKSYTLSHRFTLFLGKNEDGKTLTIDALVKLLLGRNVRGFTLIDRVEESPEGYVIVEDDQGREVKVPEKGILPKVADLTPSECRSIFVIRNSDLSIPHEGEFYMSLTDRLIGLRTEEISRIKEALRGIGRITPGGTFRDIKDEKLKTRIENAENLLDRIARLGGEIREEKYDELEEEAGCYSDRLDRVMKMIGNFEDARKREEYEKGKTACHKLKESLRKSEDMKIYVTGKEHLWRDCLRDIQRLEKEKKGLETEIEGEKAELKTVSKEHTEKERDFRIIEEAKNRIDEEIRQEIINHKGRCEELALRSKKAEIMTLTWKVCAIFFGVCLLGIIFRPSSLFFVLAASFLALAVILWTIRFQSIRYEAKLDREFQRIKLTLSPFELGAETMEGILSKIQRFDLGYRTRNEELQDLRRRKENVEGRIRELTDEKIPDIDREISGAEDQIDRIKMESKQGSLEEYTEKLIQKQEFEKLVGEYQSVLQSHFGEIHENLEQNIVRWEREIGTLERYKEKAKGIRYSEEATSELEKEKQQLEEALKEINGKMGAFQKGMADVERKANEILRSEGEYLYCTTSVDLEAVKDKLNAFIKENKRKKDNALQAIWILEEIEEEEKEKVSELFDTESPISKYFSDITGGLYEEVTLNQAMGEIEVRRADGVVLSAEKLSGGAYDQLYLSVRLALGEKLLKERTGFFIMDDPFIKADPNRLRREVEMLKMISALGWQILYFSAKEEVEAVLKEDIKSGVVNRVEIQSIFS